MTQIPLSVILVVGIEPVHHRSNRGFWEQLLDPVPLGPTFGSEGSGSFLVSRDSIGMGREVRRVRGLSKVRRFRTFKGQISS